MSEVTRRRRGVVMRGVFAVLLDEPDGLHVQEVIARTKQRVPPTEFEQSYYPERPDLLRYDNQLRWHSIAHVKAGWLVKGEGKQLGRW